MTEEDVAALLQRAAQGDQHACGALYRSFHASVRRVAAGFAVLGPAEVEDVVQDTFVSAFKALPALSHPRAFGRWLLTIARNRAIAVARAARAREAAAETLLHEHDVQAPALPDALALERRVEVVRELIERLPEGPEKQTVRLFYLEGELSAREIAERLGVGKSAVTMRLERFRARVKRELLSRLLAVEVG